MFARGFLLTRNEWCLTQARTYGLELFSCLQEYALLKNNLVGVTRKSGGVLAAYLLLTVDAEAAVAALTGTAAGSLYMSWLCRDIDNVKPTDRVPLWEAEEVCTGVGIISGQALL